MLHNLVESLPMYVHQGHTDEILLFTNLCPYNANLYCMCKESVSTSLLQKVAL